MPVFKKHAGTARQGGTRAPVLPQEAVLWVQPPPGVTIGGCPQHAEVWYVALRHRPPRKRDDFDPYCIARCACGWVGDAHDARQAEALAAASADAFSHAANVEPGVGRPLD